MRSYLESWLSRACCFGFLKGSSKSVQVLLNGIEAVMVLTFDISEIANAVLALRILAILGSLVGFGILAWKHPQI